MKKLLLLSASALLSLSAMAQVSEPTLTKDWETTENMPVLTNARWGAAYGGKFYINEKGTGLHCYSYDESTKKVTRSTIEGVTAAGVGLNFDSKGNAVLLNGWAGAGSMTNLVLWNSTTNETKNLTITVPENFTTTRMDYLGRIAGDIWSEEGGAFFYYSYNSVNSVGDTEILKVVIKNAEQDVENTKTIVDVEKNCDNATVVIPLTNDPASNEIVYRYRSNKNFVSFDGSELKTFASATTPSSTAGGDIVKLNGILFTIEPVGTNYYDGWQIVEHETNTVVATVEESKDPEGSSNYYKDATSYTTVLSAEKISETKANIYHYHKGLYLKKYTFEVPDKATAIESVAVDANAPVEYYNLQGVKVANPENGLFIKKQGNKATKVIL